MRILLITVFMAMTGCAEVKSSPSRHHKARITFYGGHREKVAQGGMAKEGVTVAASPKRGFGTSVMIPQLQSTPLLVQDRGSAVTSMKASHGLVEVIDVYIASAKKLARLARELPEYMDVE